MFKRLWASHSHIYTHSLSFSLTHLILLFMKITSQSVFWGWAASSHLATHVSFSTPQSVQSKDSGWLGCVCVCVCMCHCLVKQVKNVSGDDPFLPQAHLGIFGAPSTFLSLFSLFCSDRSDSSGWLAWVLRETAFLCVCVYMCIGEHDTAVKPSVSLVFCWCATVLCRGADLELNSLYSHVAWAVQETHCETTKVSKPHSECLHSQKGRVKKI